MNHHELSDLNELGEEELPVDYDFADVKEEDCSICLEVLTEESFECPQCKKKITILADEHTFNLIQTLHVQIADILTGLEIRQ